MSGHRHAFAVDAACDCGIMLSELIGSLSRELAEARQTIARLNRRCQSAESGLAMHLPTGDRTFGRALANSAATMYRHQRDEAVATLAVVAEHLGRIEASAGEISARLAAEGSVMEQVIALAEAIVAECRRARG